jgi:hypothetical protein
MAKALLDANPKPTGEDVRKPFSGNLCRCTGYHKVVEAILAAAAEQRGESPPERKDSGGEVPWSIHCESGWRFQRSWAPHFADDLKRPGMLCGAMISSPHAHARSCHRHQPCADS